MMVMQMPTPVADAGSGTRLNMRVKKTARQARAQSRGAARAASVLPDAGRIPLCQRSIHTMATAGVREPPAAGNRGACS